MSLLNNLEKRREHFFPNWKRKSSIQTAEKLYKTAQKWSKDWKGRGSQEDLEMAMETVHRALNYVTYLHLSHLYRKIKSPKILMDWQDQLFTSYSTLSMTEYKRRVGTTGIYRSGY